MIRDHDPKGGIILKKEFSQEEMEQILKNDAVIPASVDERIKETYDRLGLTATAPKEHDKGNYIKTMELGGMNVDLFSSDSIYTDDDTTRQDVVLTSEDYGYMIQVFLNGTDLADDEALKVAEGLDIQVSDETVPYATDEEIAKIKDGQTADFDSAYDSSLFYNVGDVITDPQDKDHKTEFKVTDVRLADSLPLDQFPKENYVPDYDSTVAPLLNEDGTLKSHERYSPASDSLSKEDLETADSKFIIATVEITNTGDSSTKEYITPMLEYLSTDGDGSYTRFSVQSASAAYQALSVDGEPLYQSVQQYTDNQKQHVRFAEIGAGETLECTFAWVVDDDCTDNAYLSFFDMYGGMTNSYPRVKVAE